MSDSPRQVVASSDTVGTRDRIRQSACCYEVAVTAARKIRVCIAAPSLDFYAGQAIQGLRLIQTLRTEPELEIGFIPHNPRLPGPIRWLQRIKYVRTGVTTFYYLLLLLCHLPRYDVIQVFSASYWSYLFSAMPPLLVAKLYRKKIILNYRSGEAEDHLRRWPRTTVPLMRRMDEIVVPSGYLVDVFARFGLKARAIFNIVDLERFKYRERAVLGPRFLCTRLLEPLYNVANVIRAFRLIKDEVPEATLTIAADGSQRARLEKLVADLRLDSVTFRGFVPFDEMPALYDAHDLHLIGNDIDNMPAAVTESCASGIIIVTTAAGGIPYLVENGRSALIVACGDVAGLAREALRALRNPALSRTLARNARERAQDFTWPRVRGQWLALYRELAGR
jgi:glycosyltransferase involved in cell wall biosynthesis